MYLVVKGKPPRKNARYRIGTVGNRARMWDSEYYRDFVLRLQREWVAMGSRRASKGSWHIHLVSYWPRVRKLDERVPYGDIDAPVSIVLDALEAVGAIDDDVRVVSAELHKRYDPDDPRIEIMLTPTVQTLVRQNTDS